MAKECMRVLVIGGSGYCLPDIRVHPSTQSTGRTSIAIHSFCDSYKPLPQTKIRLTVSATSGNQRRNPDFSRQNKQGQGFLKGKGRQNLDRDVSEPFEETDILSTKNGPLLSLSNSPRFQATSTPGPREKEIVELFRKVQIQLRERAAIKEEKKTETSQAPAERGTVDSLLRLLRKHSSDQGKRKGSSEGSIPDRHERTSSLDDEQDSNIFNTNSAMVEVQEPPATPTRPQSNFRRKSPVPRIKYQSVFSIGETTDSPDPPSRNPFSKSSGRRRKKDSVQSEAPEAELISSDELEVLDEVSLPEILEEIPLPEVLEEISESNPEESYTESTELPASKMEDLNSLKLSELRILAKSRGVKGYSKMKKGEIIEILNEDSDSRDSSFELLFGKSRSNQTVPKNF